MQHQSITDYQGHYYFNPEYIYEEGNPRPVLIYKNVVYFTVDSKGVHHYHQTFCGQFQDPEQFANSYPTPQPYQQPCTQPPSLLALPAGESPGTTNTSPCDEETKCPDEKTGKSSEESSEESSEVCTQEYDKRVVSRYTSRHNDGHKSSNSSWNNRRTSSEDESASWRDDRRRTNSIVPFRQRSWRRPPAPRNSWVNYGSPHVPLLPGLCCETSRRNHGNFRKKY